MPTQTSHEVQGIDEAKLLELVNETLRSSQLTEKDVDRIFGNSKKIHEEFQRKLEATIPSYTDRQRIYTL